MRGTGSRVTCSRVWAGAWALAAFGGHPRKGDFCRLERPRRTARDAGGALKGPTSGFPPSFVVGALPGAALLQKGPTSPVKGKLRDGEQEESTFVNEHGVGRMRAVP